MQRVDGSAAAVRRRSVRPGALDSPAQITAWAIVFGYAQQLFTRFVVSAHEHPRSGHDRAGGAVRRDSQLAGAHKRCKVRDARAVKILAGALVVLAVSPATAGAATFTATASSPRDPALDASLDLSQVTATFDTAGSFWIDTRVWGGYPSGITGTVYAAAPAGGCGAPVGSIVRDPNGNQTATVTPPGGPPEPAQSPQFLLAAGQFAGAIADPGLAGITPGCVAVTASNSSGAVDTLAPIPFAATAAPPPSPFPPIQLPTNPNPHANTSPLIANRRGVVAIPLGRFSPAVRGTVTVRAGKRTLGRKAFRAGAGRPATVHVRLNAASRRRLAHGRTLKVKIVAMTRVPGTNITSRITFTTTIRRRKA
jgi:hypothetical protein